MIDKVKKYIEKYNMIEKHDEIILGISGGADSVCLFFVLLELRKIYEFELIGVHVNHNLRGQDAKNDQEYVRQICAENKIPCIIADVDVAQEAKRRRRSLEEAGREVRQEAYAKAAEGRNQVKIATAHHSNDNAETMLMNLVRGTGITGLAGISPIVGNKIRPLLCVTRKEIEKYLEENKILYCIDKTNNENIYTRNIIRNQVIPIMEQGVNAQAVPHINRAIEDMAKIEAYLQEQVDKLWNQAVEVLVGDGEIMGECSLRILENQLNAAPRILQERLVKQVLEQVAGSQRDIGRVHVEQVLELMEKQVGREVHLPYEMNSKRIYQGVEVTKTCKEAREEQDVKHRLGQIRTRVLEPDEYLEKCKEKLDAPYTKYFDYDIIKRMPVIRKRMTGDYIVINGNGNRQTLKKYFVTNKIPQGQRKEIDVVACDNEVLWVVGCRVSSGYEITEKTNKILEIQYDGGNYGRNS